MVSRVDPDHVAGLDEQRDMNRRPGLESGRFGFARHGVAFVTWIGRHHFQVDVDRQFDADQTVLIALQEYRAPLLQKRQHGLEHVLVDGDLVIGLRVHEVVMCAVRIGVRRLRAVDADRAVLVPAAEALLKDRAGEHVAQLGLDHRAHRAGGLLLEEVDELTFVVALEDADLEAELAGFIAHHLVEIVQRPGAVDVRLALAEKVEVRSMDDHHSLHVRDLVRTLRTTAPGTVWPISAWPMRRGMTQATLPRRAFLSTAMAASTRFGSACGGLSGRPKAWRSSSCESTVRLLHRSRARATRAATRMPKATARPWVTRNAVAASSAWPAVWP